MGCLGITERCVDILLIVENEIREAGMAVAEELALPLQALTLYVHVMKRMLIIEIHCSA